MHKLKGPSWRDMIIPLGMGGGAVVGFLVAIFTVGSDSSEVRTPDDPVDAPAILGVFFMFAGTVVGTVVGVIVAVVLYLKRKWEVKYK